MSACRISRLRLYNFRNYDEAVVEPGPGLNVFSGRNAQGKTNLLEAVATLTLTRSPRAPTSVELLRWGHEQCQVDAHVERPGGAVDLSVRFTLDAANGRVGRVTSVDGKPRPARALLGVCPVVLFWPDDLLLVKAGPDGRRRLLDVVLSQLDARTATDLIRYRRALEQRNALLKQLREGRSAPDALAAFDVEFADHGARVRVARARLVADLSPMAGASMATFGGKAERLELVYVTDPLRKEAVDSVEKATESLLEAMAARRGDELARGVSLVGPHRDDVEILLSDRPARSTASQGQQRSIVLALKLAEVRHVQTVAGMAPILILDDVLSELDSRRRGALLTAISDADLQVLVTSAEPDVLGSDGGLPRDSALGSVVTHFEVESGRVQRVA